MLPHEVVDLNENYHATKPRNNIPHSRQVYPNCRANGCFALKNNEDYGKNISPNKLISRTQIMRQMTPDGRIDNNYNNNNNTQTHTLRCLTGAKAKHIYHKPSPSRSQSTINNATDVASRSSILPQKGYKSLTYSSNNNNNNNVGTCDKFNKNVSFGGDDNVTGVAGTPRSPMIPRTPVGWTKHVGKAIINPRLSLPPSVPFHIEDLHDVGGTTERERQLIITTGYENTPNTKTQTINASTTPLNKFSPFVGSAISGRNNKEQCVSDPATYPLRHAKSPCMIYPNISNSNSCDNNNSNNNTEMSNILSKYLYTHHDIPEVDKHSDSTHIQQNLETISQIKSLSQHSNQNSNKVSISTLAALKSAYMLTKKDITVPHTKVHSGKVKGDINWREEGRDDDDEVGNDLNGTIVRDLAPRTRFEICLKKLPLTEQIPVNTFKTLTAPSMKVCTETFIVVTSPENVAATPSKIIGRVSVSPNRNNEDHERNHNTHISTDSHPHRNGKHELTEETSTEELHHHNQQQSQNKQYHLIIDLSKWDATDEAPIIRLSKAFMYDVQKEEHHMDRSLSYEVHTNVPGLFLDNTPIVTDDDTGTLTIIPDPTVCGTALMIVKLADNASFDTSTGQLMKSDEVVIAVHLTKGKVISTTSGKDDVVSPLRSPSRGRSVSRERQSQSRDCKASRLDIRYPSPTKVTTTTGELQVYNTTSGNTLQTSPRRLEAMQTVQTYLMPMSLSLADQAKVIRPVPGECYPSFPLRYHSDTVGDDVLLVDSKQLSPGGEDAEGNKLARYSSQHVKLSDYYDDAYALVPPGEEVISSLYEFPVPDANMLRCHSVLSNQVEILQQALKADGEGQCNSSASLHSNNGRRSPGIGTDASGTIYTPLPLFTPMNPVVVSCLTDLERVKFSEFSQDRYILSDVSALEGGEADEARGSGEKDIALSLSPVTLAALTNMEVTLQSRIDEMERLPTPPQDTICKAYMQLAKLYVTLGASHKREAMEAFDTVLLIRAKLIGLASMDEIGVKDPSLDLNTVTNTDISNTSEKEKCNELSERCNDLIESVMMVGTFMKYTGEYKRAFKMFSTAALASDKYLGSESVSYMNSLVKLAELGYLRGDYHYASDVMHNVVAISEVIYGQGDIMTDTFVNLLGICYVEEGNYSQGLICHDRVLKNRRINASLVSAKEEEENPEKFIKESIALIESMLLAAFTRVKADDLSPVTNSERENKAQELMKEAEQLMRQISNSPIMLHNDDTDGRKRFLSESKMNNIVISMCSLKLQLSRLYQIKGQKDGLFLLNEAYSDILPSQRNTEAAIILVDCVAYRIFANDFFNPSNCQDIMQAIGVLTQSLGSGHPIVCRALLLQAQLLRSKDYKLALHISSVAFDGLHNALLPSHIDNIVSEVALALAMVQNTPSGRISNTTQEAVYLALFAWERLESSTASCSDRLQRLSSNNNKNNNTSINSSFEYVSERVIEPALVAICSMTHTSLPLSFSQRLEFRIKRLRNTFGRTSPRLIEPYYILGLYHYNTGSVYTIAHHYLAKALEAADSTNTIFLLGHLFKPATHLTATDLHDRNRISNERLNPEQTLQIAGILYAVGSVYAAEGKSEDAKSTIMQALAALELCGCQKSIATTITLTSLAKVLYREGHYGDALARAYNAIVILEDYHITSSALSPNIVSSTCEVGQYYARDIKEVIDVIEERIRSKGYSLERQESGRYRFIVHF